MASQIRTVFLAALQTVFLLGCSAPQPLADACTSPLSSAIANSCVVTPDALWRGAKPDAAGAASLISLGVRTVVNLELLHDDQAAFLAARPSTALSTGIDYFRIRDWEPNVIVAPGLLESHIADFLAILKTQPKPIYVHCRSGQNRTGIMVAAYRVFIEGWSIEFAIGEMEKYQGVWFAQDARFMRSLTGERRARIEKLTELRMKRIQRVARLSCSTSGCIEK